MTNYELVNKAIDVALAHKTVYGIGMFGHRLDKENFNNFYYGQYLDWYQNPYKNDKIIPFIDKGYYGFDCVCFIKSLFWGWNGDYSDSRGGARPSAAFPDHSVHEVLLNDCEEVSSDFSSIEPGEFLVSGFKNNVYGHCGLYIGDGLAVDCTNSDGQNGVEIRAVANIGDVSGYKSKTWLKHAKLTRVEYITDKISSSLMQIKRELYYSGETVTVIIDRSKMDSSYTEPILGIYSSNTANYEDDYIYLQDISENENISNFLLPLYKKDENNVNHALKEGTYRIILFKNKKYEIGDILKFDINAAKVCDAFYANGWVDVSINGHLSTGSWIGIYPKNMTSFDADHPSVIWKYVPPQFMNHIRCRRHYFSRFRIQYESTCAGDYQVALFADNDYNLLSKCNISQILAHTDITVSSIEDLESDKKPVIMTAVNSIFPGESIFVKFYGVTNKGAWIGLYPLSIKHDYGKCTTGMWCYTATNDYWNISDVDRIVHNGIDCLYASIIDVNTGTLRYLSPGYYQVALFKDDTYDLEAVSQIIEVKKPTIQLTSQSVRKAQFDFRYYGAPCYDSWVGIYYNNASINYSEQIPFGWSRVEQKMTGVVSIKAFLSPSVEYRAVLFVNSNDTQNGGQTYKAIASCSFLASYD